MVDRLSRFGPQSILAIAAIDACSHLTTRSARLPCCSEAPGASHEHGEPVSMEDTPNASAQQKGLPAADVKAWHENEYARPPPVHGFLCAGPGAFFGPCHTLCRHSSRAQCTDRSAPRTGVSAGARSAPAGLDAADFRAPPGGEETAQERMHRHHRLLKACSWRIEKDQRGSWTLCPPRNHRRLVAFISWMVLGVGANCDIQVRSAACGGSGLPPNR